MNAHLVGYAFLLTLLAGLSTGIGSALAFFTKQTNTRFLSVSLGFSAGVMLYVSFVEIFSKAQESLVAYLNGSWGVLITVAAFFCGIALIALIDNLIPSHENVHEMHDVEELADKEARQGFNKLYRVGIFTALAITIHNFPEGMATFFSALKSISLGIPIAIAIAIHNIPEGIAVSIPIFYATGSRRKAFWFSFFSGLAEPLGALVGYLILMRFFNDLIFGILFAAVAGIMVYIAIDELLPSAEKYGEHHFAIGGVIAGMAVMAVSLLLF